MVRPTLGSPVQNKALNIPNRSAKLSAFQFVFNSQ